MTTGGDIVYHAILGNTENYIMQIFIFAPLYFFNLNILYTIKAFTKIMYVLNGIYSIFIII